MKEEKRIIKLLVLTILLGLIFLFWGLKASNWRYFLSLRIPKIIAIIITGAAIGFSSLIFQTITNNRILTPSVLGLDSLYVLIQSGVIFLLGSSSLLIVNKNLNFLVTLMLMLVFSGILFRNLFRKDGMDIMVLLLIGLILGSLFQSLTSFMQMMIDPNEFLHIQDKMFASFNNINSEILLMASMLVIGSLIYSMKYLSIWDVLSLGRDHSINLGVDYELVIKRMLVIVSILVSVSTALVGPITFLGLLAVNLAREYLKTYRHRHLIIGSILISIIALIGGQIFTERILNFAAPVSVIINFIGGCYFIILLIKENVA